MSYSEWSVPSNSLSVVWSAWNWKNYHCSGGYPSGINGSIWTIIAKCNEAPLGVLGIRDIWVKDYRDTGYLGEKLIRYGILKQEIWDIEHKSWRYKPAELTGYRILRSPITGPL